MLVGSEHKLFLKTILIILVNNITTYGDVIVLCPAYQSIVPKINWAIAGLAGTAG